MANPKDSKSSEDDGAAKASPDEAARQLLGGFIRAQRQMADLTLRQLSAMTEVSNPYLSQIERGLHEPSLRVLRSIADALDFSTETLLDAAGLTKDYAEAEDGATERAIRTSKGLTEAQRRALLAVYKSYVESNKK